MTVFCGPSLLMGCHAAATLLHVNKKRTVTCLYWPFPVVLPEKNYRCELKEEYHTCTESCLLIFTGQ